LGFLVCTCAWAAWPTDAGEDLVLANEGPAAPALGTSVMLDGLGGVFVVWGQSLNGRRLFGEHVCADGTRLWGTTQADGGILARDLLGMSVGNDVSGWSALSTSDGQGGFFSVYAAVGTAGGWTATAQRFSGTGAPLWPASFAGGTGLGALGGSQSFQLIQDGLGGVIVAPADGRMILHRLDATGARPYGVSGVDLGYGFDSLTACPPCEIAPDGVGGAYVMWNPWYVPVALPAFAHVDPSGALVFYQSDDVPQGAKPGTWSVTPPAGAGPWVSWIDDAGTSISLQHFDGVHGVGLLDAGPAGGIPVAALQWPGSVQGPLLSSDGAGGTVLIWFDQISGQNVLLASRFGPDGSPVWAGQPFSLASATSQPSGGLSSIRVFPTNDGALLVFWSHYVWGLWAEKLRLGDGARLWGPTSGGMLVSGDFTPEWFDVAVDSDNGVFVAFSPGQGMAVLKHLLPDGAIAGPPDAGCVVPVAPDAGSGADGGADGGFSGDAGDAADGGGGGLDAGAVTDAGTVADSGVDAGGGSDAGLDAGVGPVGSDGGSGLVAKSGCGCASSGENLSATIVLLALAMQRARRRA
jgi:hypothetical protein